MPRQVDAEMRRRQVAEALLRVVEREGLEAASIPRIARELGATTGLVQTYFRSKDDLLLFAVRHMGDVLEARIADAVDGAEGIRERLWRGLCVLVGAEPGAAPEQGGAQRIWLAFLARAVVHPELRDLHVKGAEEIRARCREAFAAARRSGEVAGDFDCRGEAVALAAFVDGLTVQRVIEPETITAEVARAQLGRYLDRVFAGTSGEEGEVR